jgi:anionic cell wall polymer biosynthesis LytR-Cps2A-Psr (LCP) family protein
MAVVLWLNRQRVPVLRDYYRPNHTVLLVGLDDGGRADAIGVVYRTDLGLRVLIVPRDTYCSHGRKLNALFRRLGADGFRQVIAQILGHDVDDQFVVRASRLSGFLERTFPAGLELNVPYRLHYADRAGGFSYSIPAGRQRLRGADLEWFVRDRKSDPAKRGEAARVERWRILARTGLAELTRFENLPRLPSIAADAAKSFETTLRPGEVAALAAAYRRSGHVSVTYLPGRPLQIGSVSFVQLDKDTTRRQARLALRGIVPPANLMVYVLNGTSCPGLARQTARELERAFGVACEAGNAASAWEKRTTIEYTRRDLAPLAAAIAECVHGSPRVRPIGDELPAPAVVVTIGTDALPQVARCP